MIITILNNKGGVGKTTITAHLAHAFSMMGKKVLCVDIDTQANLMYHIFEEYFVADLKARQNGTVLPVQHDDITKIDVLPLSFFQATQRQLTTAIKNAADDYDIVLIDSPPSLELRTMAGLDAADAVIVPTEAEKFAIIGLIELENICKQKNIPILGILVNKMNPKKATHRQIYNGLVNNWLDRVYSISIPDSSIFSAASGRNMTAYTYMAENKKPNPALEAMNTVAKSILKKLEAL